MTKESDTSHSVAPGKSVQKFIFTLTYLYSHLYLHLYLHLHSHLSFTRAYVTGLGRIMPYICSFNSSAFSNMSDRNKTLIIISINTNSYKLIGALPERRAGRTKTTASSLIHSSNHLLLITDNLHPPKLSLPSSLFWSSVRFADFDHSSSSLAGIQRHFKTQSIETNFRTNDFERQSRTRKDLRLKLEKQHQDETHGQMSEFCAEMGRNSLSRSRWRINLNWTLN